MKLSEVNKLKSEFTYHLINMIVENDESSFEKTLKLIDRVALNDITVYLMAAFLQAQNVENYEAMAILKKQVIANLDIAD